MVFITSVRRFSGSSERRAVKTLIVTGISESVSVCIRGICITCDGILEHHLEIRRRSGWNEMDNNRSDAKSRAVFHIEIFPSDLYRNNVPSPVQQVCLDFQNLTLGKPEWNVKLLSSSYT
jgi:hypothetical protein